jgi:hypothetical protein
LTAISLASRGPRGARGALAGLFDARRCCRSTASKNSFSDDDADDRLLLERESGDVYADDAVDPLRDRLTEGR